MLTSDQRGFTLVEMMIASLLLVVIVTATLAVLDATTRAANEDFDRSDSIQEAQRGVKRMADEIRHAVFFYSAAPNKVDFVVRRQGSATPRTRVVYTCSVADSGRGTPGAGETYEMCTRQSTTAPDTDAGSPRPNKCCRAPTSADPTATIVNRVLNGDLTVWGEAGTTGDTDIETCNRTGTDTRAPVFNYFEHDLSTDPDTIKPYCETAGTTLTTASNAARLDDIFSVNIAILTPRRGERLEGLGGNIYLQAASALREKGA